jgi:hypothetical protein
MKIKILCNWTKNTKDYFKKQLKENESWDNFTLTNDKYADFYVIINQLFPNSVDNYYDENKTIYLTMEPSFSKWRNFLNYFVNYKSKIYYHKINGIEWWISKSYNQLLEYKMVKSKNMSSIISDNYFSEYHIKRVNFLKHIDILEDVDLYGRLTNFNNKGFNIIKNLNNYRGSLKTKDDGLFPYKYTLVCENAREQNYFTEKLVDGILSECLCFYSGCPNISDFIDLNAIILIDLDKPNEALNIISEAIKTNQWEQRIDYIKKEKNKILNELQLIPTIISIIKNKF